MRELEFGEEGGGTGRRKKPEIESAMVGFQVGGHLGIPEIDAHGALCDGQVGGEALEERSNLDAGRNARLAWEVEEAHVATPQNPLERVLGFVPVHHGARQPIAHKGSFLPSGWQAIPDQVVFTEKRGEIRRPGKFRRRIHPHRMELEGGREQEETFRRPSESMFIGCGKNPFLTAF